MRKSEKDYPPIDLSRLNTIPTQARQHKVDSSAVAKLPQKDASVASFLDSLPDFLGARRLRLLAETIAAAFRRERPVFFAMGAHLIKVGCAPIVIDLMRRGIVRGIAMNGAGGIHDYEMAWIGQTSEDVEANLRDGRFGMAREAPSAMAEAARRGREEGGGLGAALGRLINERRLPMRKHSLYAAADTYGALATLHVALGTDTVHMHPQASGADLGEASLIDFRRLCSAVADLGGGVWVNIGSAVILPEVFLKAVAVARNLGADLDGMVTANLDMQAHYRVQQNVLTRPVREGHGIQVIGHHELTLPLLRMWILQLIE